MNPSLHQPFCVRQVSCQGKLRVRQVACQASFVSGQVSCQASFVSGRFCVRARLQSCRQGPRKSRALAPVLRTWLAKTCRISACPGPGCIDSFVSGQVLCRAETARKKSGFNHPWCPPAASPCSSPKSQPRSPQSTKDAAETTTEFPGWGAQSPARSHA